MAGAIKVSGIGEIGCPRARGQRTSPLPARCPSARARPSFPIPLPFLAPATQAKSEPELTLSVRESDWVQPGSFAQKPCPTFRSRIVDRENANVLKPNLIPRSSQPSKAGNIGVRD